VYSLCTELPKIKWNKKSSLLMQNKAIFWIN
jgi:hypothetical protein